jgi:hypothetical protein
MKGRSQLKALKLKAVHKTSKESSEMSEHQLAWMAADIVIELPLASARSSHKKRMYTF